MENKIANNMSANEKMTKRPQQLSINNQEKIDFCQSIIHGVEMLRTADVAYSYRDLRLLINFLHEKFCRIAAEIEDVEMFFANKDSRYWTQGVCDNVTNHLSRSAFELDCAARAMIGDLLIKGIDDDV